MTITVRLFAILRELAGTGQFTLDVPGGATAGKAAGLVAERFPEIAPHLPRVALAINHDYARSETPLRDGDELALLPPVSGGCAVAAARCP